MPRRISPDDLMDAEEVADAFGVTRSSLSVAMSKPDTFPALSAHLPDPLRRVGNSWVWLRADVNQALRKKGGK